MNLGFSIIFPIFMLPLPLLSIIYIPCRKIARDDNLPDSVKEFMKKAEEIDFTIHGEVTGGEIDTALLILNDLVRICADNTVQVKVGQPLLENILCTFDGLSSFPKIETPFATAKDINGRIKREN